MLNLIESLIAGYFVVLIISLVWKIKVLDRNHALCEKVFTDQAIKITEFIDQLAKLEQAGSPTQKEVLNQEYRKIMKEMARYHTSALSSTHLKQLWLPNVLRQIYAAYRFRHLGETKLQVLLNNLHCYRFPDGALVY